MDKAKLDKIIALNIKKRCRQLGFTQKQVAKEAGITVNHMNRAMSGASGFSKETLLEITNVLSCSVDYLLGYAVDIYVDFNLNEEYENLTKDLTESEKILLFKVVNLLKEELIELR